MVLLMLCYSNYLFLHFGSILQHIKLLSNNVGISHARIDEIFSELTPKIGAFKLAIAAFTRFRGIEIVEMPRV